MQVQMPPRLHIGHIPMRNVAQGTERSMDCLFYFGGIKMQPGFFKQLFLSLYF